MFTRPRQEWRESAPSALAGTSPKWDMLHLVDIKVSLSHLGEDGWGQGFAIDSIEQ